MTASRVVITQGHHSVSENPGVSISTLLGSCVACCLWDPVRKVGGMNHMLLTIRTTAPNATCDRAGVNAMELLINDLLKLGAVRARLQAKVFGGAQMVDGLSQIGLLNSAFALDFLARERIACIGKSLGGVSARQLVYWPTTGAARQKLTRIPAADLPPPRMPPQQTGNDLELF